MGRLDGRGSLDDGWEMNTVSVNVTLWVVGLLDEFMIMEAERVLFSVGISAS
jgi:hypothetical protein